MKPDSSDPVLSYLSKAAESYKDIVSSLQADLNKQKKALNAAEMRAEHLADIVKQFHRALYSGNIYELVLRACLSLTSATRGLYVTFKPGEKQMRVRASVGNDGEFQSPLSDFIYELCERVLKEEETVVSNSPHINGGFPHPVRSGERFKNLIAAPVMLLRDFNGIVIAADKPGKGFDKDDAHALLSIGDQAAVAVENAQLRQRLETAYMTTVTVLADAMEAKDPYTQGHCEQVSRFARRIAESLDLPERERSIVSYAALLHDIGKIGVSDGILNKPGPLLPEERELVRAHVRVGHDLLRHVPEMEDVAEAVLYHHEWYDGNGYPDGLRGEAIPLASRIVSVVDAYGAMVSKRSYKEAYPLEQVREELLSCKGSQFDPRIVDALLTLLDTPETAEADEDSGLLAPLLPGFITLRHSDDEDM